MKAVVHRRRAGRALLRAPAQEGRPAPRGHGLRAQPARRHLRLRRRVLGRDRGGARRRPIPRSPRRWRPSLPPLGRHRDPLPRRGADLDRPRLLGALAPDAARDPGRPLPRRRACSLCFEREVTDPASARAAPTWSSPPTASTRWCASATASTSGRTCRRAPQPLRLARHHPAVPGVHLLLQDTTAHGLWRVHAYQYEPERSTFIVEAREETWRAAGLDRASEADDDRVLRAAVRRGAAPATGWSRTARSGAASRPCATSAGTTATSCWSATPRTPRTSRSARAPSWRWRTRSRWPRRSARTRDDAGGARGLRGGAAPGGREPAARGAGEPPVVRGHRALHGPRADPVRLHPADAQPAHHPREPEGARSRRSSRGSTRWFAEARPAAVEAGVATPAAARRRRRRRCSRRSGCATWCSPTASWSRRCASTRPRTACPTTGTSCTSARAPIGGAGLVFAEMTDVSREARISPGLHRALQARARGGVEAHRRLRAPRTARAKIGIQLGHAGRKGSTRLLWEGDDEPLPAGNWPIVSRLADSRTSRTARCRAR